MKRIYFLILLFFSQAGSSVASEKVHQTVSDALTQSEQVDVILYLSMKADLSKVQLEETRLAKLEFVYKALVDTANVSQKKLLSWLNARKLDYRAFYIENAILIKNIDQKMISLLSAFEEIESIRLNNKARLSEIKSEKSHDRHLTGVRSHLKLIKADQVWQEFNVKGQGIVIAGQDTGYRWDHQSIKRQYRGYTDKGVDHNYNWHDAIHDSQNNDCGNDSSFPCDDRGHGTHTMGTMVGDDGDDNQIGVAPEAKWIGCRNMDDGVGSVASYLECFEFFLAPYPIGGNPRQQGRVDLAPHIVNNSWSCPRDEGCTGGELLDAIEALKAAGIMVIVAAGNDGPSCDSIADAPSTYSQALVSVGAYNRYTKDIAYFSSVGPSAWDGGLVPHVIAPGTLIRSAVHTGVNDYDDKSGTSMAAPHVAGVVALLWSAKPELQGDIAQTNEILRQTAAPMTTRKSCSGFPGHEVPNAVFGHGMIDALNAVRTAMSLND